jgi:hypothetical protein
VPLLTSVPFFINAPQFGARARARALGCPLAARARARAV